MPIQSQDIKIFESDTMADVEEGGGGMTGNVIIDGESNNIFEDISTLDRVYGAVHMRKVFPGVFTQTQDKYFGAHVIISKLPGDQKIGVNLFNTQDWFDRRPVAQSRVENYRAKGADYIGFLWATQYKDSKVITIFQSETSPIPGIGEVLYLTQSNDTQNQFIKIVRLDEEVQTFTDQQGVFRRRILTIEISQPLSFDFVGAQVTRYDTITPTATIKQTIVANAAKYFSARPLAIDAEVGDLSLRVDSVYSQVIPSSTQELAITDADPNGYTATLTPSASANVSFTTSSVFQANSVIYLGNPCTPGSLSITISGGTITDDSGQLRIGANTIGVINYADGTLTFAASSPTYSGTKTISFLPAASPVKIADTAMLAVTEDNRGLVWTHTITPAPKPGSIQVSYRALGNWYTLYDNGGGGLAGQEAGIGSGKVNYATGTLSVTFAALPDANSEIIITWGRDARYFNRSDIAPDPFAIKHQLQHQGVAPGTLTIEWSDGTNRTITAASDGSLSGYGSGYINHATGELEFWPNTLPLGGTDFEINYQYGDAFSQTFNAPLKNPSDELVLDLDVADLVPNSIEVSWNVTGDIEEVSSTIGLLQQNVTGNQIKQDNGSGALQGIAGSVVDYADGIITFKPDVTIGLPIPVYQNVVVGEEYYQIPPSTIWTARLLYESKLSHIVNDNRPVYFPQDGSGSVTVRYRLTDSPQAETETITLSAIELDLSNGYAEAIVPGSVRFRFGGDTYIDRNGQLYANISPVTGAGTYAGTIDYSTGNIVLNSWATGSVNDIDLLSLTTQVGKEPVASMVFRIPSAPVRPQSFQLRAVPIDGGGQITATADETGYINGTGMVGRITYETGVVFLRFGEWVVAAGNEGEEWFDPSAVDEDGMIFRPSHVYADTIFFNAVSQTFLPLDATILGLNPVRLPQDGRIPVYAPGDVVVILNDQTTVGTFTNGQQTDLGRIRIAKLSIRDSANQELEANRYSVDLNTGLIDWVDLSGVSQPLTITDRIEDMAVLTDVQITGRLGLSQPLTHDYELGETLVSNAIVYGDMFARTSVPFDQQTWTGVWSDQRIGSDTVGQYNNGQYPIEVDNASAIQERWALIFTSANTVNVVGENVGQILSAVSISSDISPINPNTSQPYFTLPSEGWGAGWSSGNVLRFNTIAANAPVWIIQSIAQGEATDDNYTFCLEIRGDIDTP